MKVFNQWRVSDPAPQRFTGQRYEHQQRVGSCGICDAHCSLNCPKSGETRGRWGWVDSKKKSTPSLNTTRLRRYLVFEVHLRGKKTQPLLPPSLIPSNESASVVPRHASRVAVLTFLWFHLLLNLHSLLERGVKVQLRVFHVEVGAVHH